MLAKPEHSGLASVFQNLTFDIQTTDVRSCRRRAFNSRPVPAIICKSLYE